MIFTEVGVSWNKVACKYRLSRANFKQKVGCWGYLLEPQQTPHSTTTGTAGTWQQSSQQQQPLLPYWKFNFVKNHHIFWVWCTSYHRNRDNACLTQRPNWLCQLKLVRCGILADRSSKVSVLKKIHLDHGYHLPYEWLRNPCTLSRAVHWWWTTYGTERGATEFVTESHKYKK